MKAYVCKITLRGSKPPYWWRVNIPSGISFSALSILLDLLIDAQDPGPFSFEVHQFARVWEPTVEKPLVPSFSASVYDAAHTSIDLLFAVGKPINYHRQDQIYQIRLESTDDQYPFSYPLVLKSPKGTDTYAVIKKLQDGFQVQNRIVKRPKTKADMMAQAKNGVHRIPRIEVSLMKDSPYYKKSMELMIQEIADQLREMLPEYVEQLKSEFEQKNSEQQDTFTLWETLDFYNRRELVEIAQTHGIPVEKKLSKHEVVNLIADYLLDSDRLNHHFLSLTDEETSAFEELRAAGGLMKISYDREYLFSALIDAGYVFFTDKNEIITGTDVLQAYQEISTHDFHALRKKVSYIRQCLNTVVPRYYSLIPIRKFSRVARREREPKIQASEVKELLEMIPGSMHECVIKDDTIYAEQLIQDPDIMSYVRDAQRDKPYYIMREDEIDEILRYRYPQSNRSYKEFKEYLLTTMKVDPEKVEDVVVSIHNAIALSWRVQKFFEILQDEEIIPTEKQVNELMKLYMSLTSNTRTLYNRGYTPQEMGRVIGDESTRRIGVDNISIPVIKEKRHK